MLLLLIVCLLCLLWLLLLLVDVLGVGCENGGIFVCFKYFPGHCSVLRRGITLSILRIK